MDCSGSLYSPSVCQEYGCCDMIYNTPELWYTRRLLSIVNKATPTWTLKQQEDDVFVNLDYIGGDVPEDAMTGGGSSAAQVWEAGMYHVTALDSYTENEHRVSRCRHVLLFPSKGDAQRCITFVEDNRRPLRVECFLGFDFVILSERSQNTYWIPCNSFLNNSFLARYFFSLKNHWIWRTQCNFHFRQVKL